MKEITFDPARLIPRGLISENSDRIKLLYKSAELLSEQISFVPPFIKFPLLGITATGTIFGIILSASIMPSVTSGYQSCKKSSINTMPPTHKCDADNIMSYLTAVIVWFPSTCTNRAFSPNIFDHS